MLNSILICVHKIMAELRRIFTLERLWIRLLKNGSWLGDSRSERCFVLKLCIDRHLCLFCLAELKWWMHWLWLCVMLLTINILWWSILIFCLVKCSTLVVIRFWWCSVLNLNFFKAKRLRFVIWNRLLNHLVHTSFLEKIINRGDIDHMVFDLW